MWFVLFFVSCTSLVMGYGNDEILGKGRWLVINILQCEDADQYEMQFEVTRRKINRTHDAFSLHSDLVREINITYGVEIMADKEVDGGFKFYHQITDESLCNLAKKYGGDNLEQLLTKANIDPPDCPIPEGEIIIEDFVVDYTQVEETGMYGTFDVRIYMTYTGQRIACIRLLAQFEKIREDADDEDDED